MTPDQFAALADLLGMQDSPSTECARLVLVDGLSRPDACERTGLSRQAAYKAIKRAQDGLALARQAVGQG